MSTRNLSPQVASNAFPRGPFLSIAAAPDARPLSVAVPFGLSLRSNFAWLLSGNIAYAICQWGVIVSLTKLGNSFMVGQFALGLAIATPVLTLTNLHLRAVQATDSRRLYSFSDYLRLRVASTCFGLLLIAGIASVGHYERQTAMVILAVALAKGIETLSDIYYGLFQLNDRLDQSGKSLMLRGVLSVAAVSLALHFARTVLYGCVALTFVWLGVLLLYDSRRGRQFVACCEPSAPSGRVNQAWRLVRVALPLGFATTLAALNLNIPRYFIHAKLGERQLGIYSALAYTTIAMILVTDSLGHSAIPRLARLYRANKVAEYRRLLLRLVAAAAALGLTGLVTVQIAGASLLKVIYGAEYSAQHQVFRTLVLAAAIYCVACMFTSAMTAARSFRIQAPLYGCVVAANVLACAHWIPIAGLAGAAAGMLAAALTHFVLGALLVTRLLSAPRRASLAESSHVNRWPATL